jgi:choline dehydrogenase-like flavoprotein
MLVDARSLTDGTRLEADVCVVGSGPAGLTLARELLGQGRDVLLLESGGKTRGRWAQELNSGEVVGDLYAGLRETRHRQVGGVANIWNTPVQGGRGAKYVPLDPWDLSDRPNDPLPGWPFEFEHLVPFYRRAQEVCGLGPFSYGAGEWTSPERPEIPLEADLSTRVYQFGHGKRFTRDFPAQLRESPGARLLYNATVCHLEADARAERVFCIEGAGSLGRSFRVEARTFVLAAGGIENARLLLLSSRDRDVGASGGTGFGNQHGWVGRCFMEHPRDHALTLQPYSRRLFSDATFFDPFQAPDGTVVGGRIGLSERAVLHDGLPNASVTLLPKIRDRSTLIDWATRLWLCPHSSGRRGFRGGYGWSRMKTPARWLDGFRLIVNAEQRPNPENRVVLSDQMDRFGLRRARLQWRWTEEEQEGLERLREALALWLDRSGVGRVHIRKGERPDPNACHHAGTTRMSVDPRYGVVDADGRLHGVENLYVTGGSVFPTAGYSNPTLTIVALALRLADHLQQVG